MKEKLKIICETLEIIKGKFNIDFDVKIVEGSGASLQPNNFIHISIDYINKLNTRYLKGAIIHESFHQIFSELNQMPLVEKSKRTGIKWEDDPEYYESEIKNWEKVKGYFLELSDVCDNFIKSALIMIEKLKSENNKR